MPADDNFLGLVLAAMSSKDHLTTSTSSRPPSHSFTNLFLPTTPTLKPMSASSVDVSSTPKAGPQKSLADLKERRKRLEEGFRSRSLMTLKAEHDEDRDGDEEGGYRDGGGDENRLGAKMGGDGGGGEVSVSMLSMLMDWDSESEEEEENGEEEEVEEGGGEVEVVIKINTEDGSEPTGKESTKKPSSRRKRRGGRGKKVDKEAADGNGEVAVEENTTQNFEKKVLEGVAFGLGGAIDSWDHTSSGQQQHQGTQIFIHPNPHTLSIRDVTSNTNGGGELTVLSLSELRGKALGESQVALVISDTDNNASFVVDENLLSSESSYPPSPSQPLAIPDLNATNTSPTTERPDDLPTSSSSSEEHSSHSAPSEEPKGGGIQIILPLSIDLDLKDVQYPTVTYNTRLASEGRDPWVPDGGPTNEQSEQGKEKNVHFDTNMENATPASNGAPVINRQAVSRRRQPAVIQRKTNLVNSTDAEAAFKKEEPAVLSYNPEAEKKEPEKPVVPVPVPTFVAVEPPESGLKEKKSKKGVRTKTAGAKEVSRPQTRNSKMGPRPKTVEIVERPKTMISLSERARQGIDAKITRLQERRKRLAVSAFKAHHIAATVDDETSNMARVTLLDFMERAKTAPDSGPNNGGRHHHYHHHYDGKEDGDVSILDMNVMMATVAPTSSSSSRVKTAGDARTKSAKSVVWAHSLVRGLGSDDDEDIVQTESNKQNLNPVTHVDPTDDGQSKVVEALPALSSEPTQVEKSTHPPAVSPSPKYYLRPPNQQSTFLTASHSTDNMDSNEPRLLSATPRFNAKPKSAAPDPARIERLATPRRAHREEAVPRKSAVATCTSRPETAVLKVRVSSAFSRIPQTPIVHPPAMQPPFRPSTVLTAGNPSTAPSSAKQRPSESASTLTAIVIPPPGLESLSRNNSTGSLQRSSSQISISQWAGDQQTSHASNTIPPSMIPVKVHMQRAQAGGRLQKGPPLSDMKAETLKLSRRKEVKTAPRNQLVMADMATFILSEQDAARLTSAQALPSHSIVCKDSTKPKGKQVSFDLTILMDEDRSNDFWEESESDYSLSEDEAVQTSEETAASGEVKGVSQEPVDMTIQELEAHAANDGHVVNQSNENHREGDEDDEDEEVYASYTFEGMEEIMNEENKPAYHKHIHHDPKPKTYENVLHPNEVKVKRRVDYIQYPKSRNVDIKTNEEYFDDDHMPKRKLLAEAENADQLEPPKRTVIRGQSREQRIPIPIQSHDLKVPPTPGPRKLRDIMDLFAQYDSDEDSWYDAEEPSKPLKDEPLSVNDPSAKPPIPPSTPMRVMTLQLPSVDFSADVTKPKSYSHAISLAGKAAAAAAEIYEAENGLKQDSNAMSMTNIFRPGHIKSKQPYMITGLNKAIGAVMNPPPKRQPFVTSRPISAGTLKKKVATMHAEEPKASNLKAKVKKTAISVPPPAAQSDAQWETDMVPEIQTVPAEPILPVESNEQALSMAATPRLSMAGSPLPILPYNVEKEITDAVRAFSPNPVDSLMDLASDIPFMTVTDDNNSTRRASVIHRDDFYPAAPTLAPQLEVDLTSMENEDDVQSLYGTTGGSPLPHIMPSPVPSEHGRHYSLPAQNLHLPTISGLLPTPWRTRPSSAASSIVAFPTASRSSLPVPRKSKEGTRDNSRVSTSFVPPTPMTPEEFQQSLMVLSVQGHDAISTRRPSSRQGSYVNLDVSTSNIANAKSRDSLSVRSNFSNLQRSNSQSALPSKNSLLAATSSNANLRHSFSTAGSKSMLNVDGPQKLGGSNSQLSASNGKISRSPSTSRLPSRETRRPQKKKKSIAPSKWASALTQAATSANNDLAGGIGIALPLRSNAKVPFWLQHFLRHSLLIYESIRRIQRVWRRSLAIKRAYYRNNAIRTIQRWWRVRRVRNQYVLTVKMRKKMYNPTYLELYKKQLKILSQQLLLTNTDKDVDYDDDLDYQFDIVSTTNPVRSVFCHYMRAKKRVLPENVVKVAEEMCQMWTEFGIMWKKSVAKYFKRASLALTMHLVGTFGKGFSRVHVSVIVSTVRERAPKLLKETVKKTVTEIAGIIADEDDAVVDEGDVVEDVGEEGFRVVTPLARSPSMDIQLI
ncbi:hypothetical protein HDV05_007175 [Chytridiales sp. JEL 0842]|nr:hypothetical protein HDV05_007175 [Chytridiales sp. JEL 0842]